MEKASAFSKIPTKSSMGISTMGSLKVRESSTLQLAITTLESLDSIRRRVEEYTRGPERRAMFMRVSSKQEKGTAEVPFGGLMAAGMKEILEMVYNLAGVSFTEKAATESMRETGITVCSMVEELSTFRTGSVMRALSKKTNSMEREYSTRTTL